MSNISLHVALLRIFRTTICPIDGKRKDSGQCFCKSCYFALPSKLKHGLYVSALDGDEFYDNYLSAMEYLARKGFYVPLVKLPTEAAKIIGDTGLIAALNERKQAKQEGA